MRVLVLDTYYPAFLAEHYRERTGLSSGSYQDQLETLYDRCFGTSDFYSATLRDLGHDAADVIVNCEPLQWQWARERGLALARMIAAARVLPGPAARSLSAFAPHRIAAAQIAEFAPDVVYAQDLWFLRPREIRRLRRAGILVVGQIASAPPEIDRLREYDLLISAFPHFVERFRAAGIDSELLPLGFSRSVIEKLARVGVEASAGSPRPRRVSFVGGLDPAVHELRVPLLERLSESVELDIWGYGMDRLPPDSPIRERYRGEAWGLDMYRLFAESQIVVNVHENVAERRATNMRLYEATGVGALLLTEAYDDLVEKFEPGVEVAGYEDADDLISKIDFYLQRDEARIQIAAAGQRRTLDQHSYERRIGQLVEILDDRLRARS